MGEWVSGRMEAGEDWLGFSHSPTRPFAVESLTD